MSKRTSIFLFIIVVFCTVSMGKEGDEFEFEKIVVQPGFFVTPVFRYVSEVEAGVELNINFKYHGVALGNVNGDNYDDILVSNMPGPHAYYLNNGDGTFTDRSSTLPDYNYYGHGIVLFDPDNDGDLDIVIVGKKETGARLYQNRLNPDGLSGTNYLQVVVMNPNGSYGAFGTKLYLYSNPRVTGNPVKYKEIKSAEAYLSQSTPVTHFGLGSTQQVSMKVKFLTGEEKFLWDIDAKNKYYVGFLPDITINSAQVVQEESFLFVSPRYLQFNFAPLTQIDTLKIYTRVNGVWSLRSLLKVATIPTFRGIVAQVRLLVLKRAKKAFPAEIFPWKWHFCHFQLFSPLTYRSRG